MKILALRGARLGAFWAPFALNFDQRPLKDCGLFIISGATGVGKSTLLDALCLALYNNSPRLSKSGQGVWENDLSANDARTLLHKNATDAFSEVDFVGVDHLPYRARWSVRRSRGKLSGKVQKVEMRLELLPEKKLLSEGYKETLRLIQNKIGLSFVQFTKTVLLAQNDFANFLQASDEARAEILEMLAGGEIYSQISQKAYAKYMETKARAEMLLEEQDAQILPSSEEKNQLNEELHKISQKKIQLTAEKNHLEAEKQWWEQKNNLEHYLHEAQTQFAQIENVFQNQASFFQALMRKKSAYAFESLFLNFKKIKTEQFELEKELENNQLHLKNTQNQLEEATLFFKEQECNLANFLKELEENEPVFQKVQNLDNSILSLTTELNKENEILTLLIHDYESLKKQYQLLEKEQEEKELDLKKIKSWLEHKKKHGKLHSIWEEVEYFLKENWTEKITDLQTHFEQQENAFQYASEQKENAQMQWNAAKAQLEETERQLKNQLLLELSSHLQNNKPCPLCGALSHPEPFSLKQEEGEKTDQDWEKLKNNLEYSQNEFREKEKEFYLIEQNLSLIKENLQKNRNQWQNFLNMWDSSFQEIDTNWQDKFLSNSTLFYQKAKNNIAQYQEVIKNKLSLGKELFNLNEQKNFFLSKLENNKIVLKQKKEECQKKQKELENLKLERQSFWQGKSIATMRHQYTLQKENLSENKNKAWQKKESLNNQCVHALMKKKELEEKKKKMDLNRQQIEDDFNQQLKTQEFSLEELQNLLVEPKAVFDKEWTAFEQLQQQKQQAEILLQTREYDLKQHDHSKKVETAHNFETVRQALNEKNTQLQDLENEERNKQAQWARMQQLLDNAQNLTQRVQKTNAELGLWKGIADLIGSASGKKFRIFAQQNTLDGLLRAANQQLQVLWRRYMLVRAPDRLTLGVKDLLLGSVRSVYSLSGGESFLVSLALALGLASLSHVGLESDTLFIDEGFGALDKNSMDLVMRALENLQAAGRTIGVISHIEAMQERIAVRVLVKRVGEGSIVKVEGSGL